MPTNLLVANMTVRVCVTAVIHTVETYTLYLYRMNDSRLPKSVLYGELAKGKRLHGGQRLRYIDVVKRHLKATHIAVYSRHLGGSCTRSTTVGAGHSQRNETY